MQVRKRASFGGVFVGATAALASLLAIVTSGGAAGATSGSRPHAASGTLMNPLTSSVRICDTRSGNPSQLSGSQAQCNSKRLSPSTELTVAVAGVGGLPATGLEAVNMNLTVVNPAGPGFVTVWPDGQSEPLVSNIDFQKGAVLPNMTQVTVGSDGKIDLESNSSVDVVLDVDGYFAAGSGAGYVPIAPMRLIDTRCTAWGTTAPSWCSEESIVSPANSNDSQASIYSGETQTLQVNYGSVPSSDNVAAIVANVTLTGPNTYDSNGNATQVRTITESGYLTAWADSTSETPPTASNLNFRANQGAVTNRVVVPVYNDGGGDLYFEIYNGSGSGACTGSCDWDGYLNVIVDVVGYYETGTGTQYYPLTPSRILDTRSAAGAIGPKGTMDQAIAGVGGVPATASAVALNATVTGPTAPSFMTVFPKDQPQPVVSDLNYAKGDTLANLCIVAPGTGGDATLFNYGGSAQALLDVEGYYQ